MLVRTLACVVLIIIQMGCTNLPPDAVHTISQLKADITEDDLRADVTFLASDTCAGRLTGTPGAARASEYIALAFKEAGLQTPPGQSDYFQPFEFAAGVKMNPGGNKLSMVHSPSGDGVPELKLNDDFIPRTFSASGGVEGEVVFVGYGIVEPASAGKYDAYANVDVDGKIALVLRDIPEDVTPKRRQELALYAGDRYKAKLASDRGAKAILFVTGPNSPNAGKLPKFRESDRTSSVSIPAVSISGDVGDRLLAAVGMELGQLQSALDNGQPNPHGAFAIPDTRVHVQTELSRVRKTCRNVIGVIPPSEGVEEYVLVGGHYDHIGTGEGLGSMAKQGEEGKIHNGADDNASGTSVVLELAAALAEKRRNADPADASRGLVFACWSGEELGLVGSSHYVKNAPIPLDKTAAYFNFDMVGRMKDNKLILQAVGSSPVWRPLIERRNIPAGLQLSLQDDPYLPTDATQFYTGGVPALSFFTDLHDDYNRPTDDADTLNYPDMQRIASFAEMLVNDVAQPARKVEYVRVEQKAPPAGGGMGRRAYTGTVPDFAAGNGTGVLLSDVRPGGPADLAGMRGGDIIVEFAGMQVRNLQDYQDALIGAKIGDEVPVAVMRDGQRVEMTITPMARPGS